MSLEHSHTCTVNFRLAVQIDQSHFAKLVNLLNVIGQFMFQYCVVWTTYLHKDLNVYTTMIMEHQGLEHKVLNTTE